jgi:hypothetical protein
VKKELIVTAKTVEEARKKAAAELNIAEEELGFVDPDTIVIDPNP